MNRKVRLRRAGDFRRVFERGRSVANALAVLYVLPSGLPGSRIGFAVGRRLGKAAVRNRLRRRWREVARLEWAEVPPGVDLVLVARAEGRSAGFPELRAAWRQLLTRAGLSGGGAA